MDIKSLRYKSLLTDNDGESYYDLSTPAFKAGSYQGNKGVYQVTAETEMRIDLISYAYYGNTNHIDLILKANNIFNPFSIKEGDLLVIPAIVSEDKMYAKPVTKKKNDLRQKFLDTARLSTQDQNRIKRLKEKAAGKMGALSTPLPPNMQDFSSKPIKLVDGKIILGANLNSQP